MEPAAGQRWTPPGNPRRVVGAIFLVYGLAAVGAGVGVYVQTGDLVRSLLLTGITLGALGVGAWIGLRVFAKWYTGLMNRPWGGVPIRDLSREERQRSASAERASRPR
jgi:hypothetical protein